MEQVTAATVELSVADLELISELGQNADAIHEFFEAASTVMAETSEEQDAISLMNQKILKGILILCKLRPA